MCGARASWANGNTGSLCDTSGSPRAVEPCGLADRLEQRLLVDGLVQVGGCPGPFDASAGHDVVVGRDEDHREVDPLSHQVLLKPEAVHSVHLHVEYEAPRSS